MYNRLIVDPQKQMEIDSERRSIYNYTATQQKSSATAEITRDADNVDYKFSKVTVHLTKKMPPNITQIHPVLGLHQMIYRHTPTSRNHARTQHCPYVLRLLTSHAHCPFNS